MKKFSKCLLVSMLVLMVAMMSFGCYIISAQKMDDVKGTYVLKHYTYTPQYEVREGYTPKTYDYVAGESYLYEDYLIVTGTGTGYYVHKDATGVVYSKVVTLSYEFDEEDSTKVEYVIYNDALSSNQDSGIYRLGVTDGHLGCSKTSIEIPLLISKKTIRTESLYVSWEKVDKSTSLSYVKSKLGDFAHYDYAQFGMRGLYEVTLDAESPYQYYFYVLDPVSGAMTATAYYATKESPTDAQSKTVTFVQNNDSWSEITIDGTVWTEDATWGHYTSNGVRLDCISNNIAQANVQGWIESRLPVV